MPATHSHKIIVDGGPSLGERIRKYRLRKKLSIRQVADACGTTPQAVSQWEYDAVVPQLGKLRVMADMFGVSSRALIGF